MLTVLLSVINALRVLLVALTALAFSVGILAWFIGWTFHRVADALLAKYVIKLIFRFTRKKK